MSNKRALIMAGGTGGHIFPGLAVAQALIKQGWQVEWMGTADRMEADIVPKHDINIHFIEVKGIRGNGLVRKLSLPIMLFKALQQAKSILRKYQPDVVLGFGGYASGPGGIACRLLNIPLVIHEQNAVMGMTNSWLSKVARKVFLAFPLNSGKEPSTSEVIGNPVRENINQLLSHTKRQLSVESSLRVLVVGGSLGARIFNQELPKIFAGLADAGTIEVWHQTGKGNADSVKASYQAENFQTAQVDEFIDDMSTAFEWADLIVCRAGALTVSELAASGNLGVFVPLPHAVDDHQTANANWLVTQDAGVLVPQQQLTTQLPQILGEFLRSPSRVNQMQNKVRQLPLQNTTQRFVTFCQELEVSH